MSYSIKLNNGKILSNLQYSDGFYVSGSEVTTSDLSDLTNVLIDEQITNIEHRAFYYQEMELESLEEKDGKWYFKLKRISPYKKYDDAIAELTQIIAQMGGNP